jgi:ankyrin repeat protein
MTVLEAVRAGDAEALRSTLTADPSLAKERTPEGVPAPIIAVYAGRADLAEMLLDAGAEEDLFVACVLNHLDKVARFLTEDPAAVSARSADGWTPLHYAAFFGHGELARLLLARGAYVTARSSNQMQNLPIHAAAAGRHSKLVRLLLEEGTPVDATQNGGYTALHSAALCGDVESVKALLDFGADPEHPSTEGVTAKELAREHNHAAVLELFRR